MLFDVQADGVGMTICFPLFMRNRNNHTAVVHIAEVVWVYVVAVVGNWSGAHKR